MDWIIFVKSMAVFAPSTTITTTKETSKGSIPFSLTHAQETDRQIRTNERIFRHVVDDRGSLLLRFLLLRLQTNKQ